MTAKMMSAHLKTTIQKPGGASARSSPTPPHRLAAAARRSAYPEVDPAQGLDPVAQLRRPLEVEPARRLPHLRLQLRDLRGERRRDLTAAASASGASATV